MTVIARTLIVLTLAGWTLLTAPLVAHAEDEKISLIRDTEVENIIRAYAAPVFKVAGLDPDSIKVHLVKDRRLNAFVAGGLHMFINTGLLMRSKDAGQVIGVIAHETGHVVHGDLVRMRRTIRNAQIQSIITFLLGAAAGILAQDSQAGLAVMSLGAKATEGTLLQYSRTQESAADQFAVKALDAAGISSRGLLEFMRLLQGQEFLVTARQDPYLRTHPLTSARIAFLRNHVAESPVSDAALPPKFAEMHARMRAKLIGFLDYPLRVLAKYDARDTGIEARYARAIAFYRDGRIERALPLIDKLIADFPKDPYFRELKGQVLFENGRVDEAVAAYRDSVNLLPDAPLILTSLGQALLEQNRPQADKEALKYLKQAIRYDTDNPMTWRFLGVAYGRGGDIGMASLALAESGLLYGDKQTVRQQAERAEKHLAKGTPAWQRLQDIKRSLEQAEEK